MLTGPIAERIRGFTLAEEGRRLGLYPYFRQIVSELDTTVRLADGRTLLMLGSNSYLGLTTHPKVKQAAADALRRYGTGCAGSRFLNGTLDIHVQLEEQLAAWVGKAAAMLYSTGFQVNQGVIAAMLNRHDVIIMDMDDHASIVDGARLSMARPVRYRHNDVDELASRLAAIAPEKGKFIAVDGVFSMEGDLARLAEIAALASVHGAALLVDDAHGLGVMGPQGRGTAAHFGLTDQVDLIMGTFSKSLASLGGFVAGTKDAIDYLRHRSRAFIFSASMPAAAAAAALAALAVLGDEPERRDRLWENSTMMKNGLMTIGYDTGFSATPIIPVYIGDPLRMLTMCRRLDELGLFVNPVLPPAVAPNRSLLRISLMATHTRDQIAFALDMFAKAGRQLSLIDGPSR